MSLAAASATRKRLGSRGTKRAAECAQLGAQIAMGHAFQQKTQSVRDQINEHLDANPGQVEACMLLLSQGFCDPEKSKAIASGDLERYIPDSATTLENVSNKVMVQAINFLHPELFTIPVLAKIKKTGRKALCALFCFLVQEVPKTPTPTHIIEVFNRVYKDRYEQLGKRGQLLTIVDSTIHWERSGTYRLEAEDDSESFTHIVHASGIKVALPACHKGVVNSDWTFENNWGWHQVKLSDNDSATSINVTKLFKDHEETFLKVASLELPEVSPSDSVSQVGSVRSELSTAPSQSRSCSAPSDSVKTPSAMSPACAKATPSPAKLRKVLKGQNPNIKAEESRRSPPAGSGLAGPASAPGCK